jgi:predicted Zn finger-like uncharacterized protein
MKIECPECKLVGSIDDAVVPATGIAMTCPRCKARFVAQRPESGAGGEAQLDTCPSCQYATFSEDKFSTCPQCGLVVADYQRQLRAGRVAEKRRQPPAEAVPALTPEQQRHEDEARRKYGLDQGAGQGGDAPVLAGDPPAPLLIVGWGTMAVAVGLLVYGASCLSDYGSRLRLAEAALLAGDDAPSSLALFGRFALFPILMMVYAVALGWLANRFLARQRWAVSGLENVGWTGVALAAAMELTDMAFWIGRSTGGSSIGYYAAGLGGGVLMALLWMFPPFVLVEYLRSEQFDRLGKYFS